MPGITHALSHAAKKILKYLKKITIGQVTHNMIKSDRKYSTHKYLWKIIQFAIDNGINEKPCIDNDLTWQENEDFKIIQLTSEAYDYIAKHGDYQGESFNKLEKNNNGIFDFVR